MRKTFKLAVLTVLFSALISSNVAVKPDYANAAGHLPVTVYDNAPYGGAHRSLMWVVTMWTI